MALCSLQRLEVRHIDKLGSHGTHMVLMSSPLQEILRVWGKQQAVLAQPVRGWWCMHPSSVRP